jgi:AcrR family transcriptional regulator
LYRRVPVGTHLCTTWYSSVQVAETNGANGANAAGGARERLLMAVLGHVTEHGFGDLSLREVAAAIGTSHRMLIYHFGSREGLVVAVVQAVEAAQRAFLAELAADTTLSPSDVMRAVWRRVSDPSLAPNVRLFFEIYVAALQRRPGTEGLLEDIVDSWVDVMAELAARRGMDTGRARVDARLGVAVSRGLLLDLLATGNRAAVDAAVERYLAGYEALTKVEQSSGRGTRTRRADRARRVSLRAAGPPGNGARRGT